VPYHVLCQDLVSHAKKAPHLIRRTQTVSYTDVFHDPDAAQAPCTAGGKLPSPIILFQKSNV
jgi:hypothetical protein